MQPTPSPQKPSVSRRRLLQGLGAAGAVALLGDGTAGAAEAGARPGRPGRQGGGYRLALGEAVANAPLIDTHEHLIEEHERLQSAAHPRVPCDD